LADAVSSCNTVATVKTPFRYLNGIEGNKLSIWMAARGIRYVHATAMEMKG